MLPQNTVSPSPQPSEHQQEEFDLSNSKGDRLPTPLGRNNNAFQDDENVPSALTSERYLDGKLVVAQGDKEEIEPEVEEPQEGCWYKFKTGIRSFWATRHTEDTKEDRELYIRTTLRELIIYIIFLIVLMIITYGMTGSSTYYYTKVMGELFSDTKFDDRSGSFSTASAIDDIWKFLKGPLISGLYWDTWYNNRNVSARDQNMIYYENLMLGVPRIRQVRVRNNSCSIPTNFKDEIKECFAMYHGQAEEKSAFGLSNSTAWLYSDSEKTDSLGYQGLISYYDGGGYYMDLSRQKSETIQKIDFLFKNLWIDRGTRVVFVDFTVYNANINLFNVVKLIFEIPATGGVLPTGQFRSVKLLRYVSPHDYFVLACECIFLLFILYYCVEEIIEIKKHKCSYFSSFWNWLDIAVIVISLVCACFNVYRTVAVNRKLETLLHNDDSFPNFDFLGYWQHQFNQAIAVTVFFAWVKIFKYISFNKTMTQLSSTLGRCSKDLAGFGVMFAIIFCAFAQLGYLFFGTQVKDFREFQHSIFTLFRIILGDFDFQQLEAAHRVLGPIYFILYVFFVFFILINMFLAIINDTYSEVKMEIAREKNEFEMTDYFKQRANKVLEKWNLKQAKIVEIQKAIQAADINNDHNLDFDEWRNELKSRGYADQEIEAVFSNYDVDGDRVLDESEQRRMQLELEGQKAALDECIKTEKHCHEKALRAHHHHHSQRRYGRYQRFHSQDSGGSISDDDSNDLHMSRDKQENSEMNELNKRVTKMEENIALIVTKIDFVLGNLESLEKTKARRREAMSKILDSLSGLNEGEENEDIKRMRLEELVQKELEEWEKDYEISPRSRLHTAPK